jgi:hypothetical protein
MGRSTPAESGALSTGQYGSHVLGKAAWRFVADAVDASMHSAQGSPARPLNDHIFR